MPDPAVPAATLDPALPGGPAPPGSSPFRPLPPPTPAWRRLVDLATARMGATPSALAGGALALVVVATVLVVTVRATSGSAPRPELSLPLAPGAAAAGPGGSGGSGGSARGAPARGGPGTAAPTVPDAGLPVVVHVAGAVAHAGVYSLPAGSRVADAVTAAGGGSADADPDSVNLAARLGDGDRVYLPRRGEVPPAAAGPTAPAVVDLNSASPEQLDALPGVGPALAAAIVDYRRQHGRFRTVAELGQVPGIGPAKLAVLQPKVRV